MMKNTKPGTVTKFFDTISMATSGVSKSRLHKQCIFIADGTYYKSYNNPRALSMKSHQTIIDQPISRDIPFSNRKGTTCATSSSSACKSLKKLPQELTHSLSSLAEYHAVDDSHDHTGYEERTNGRIESRNDECRSCPYTTKRTNGSGSFNIAGETEARIINATTTPSRPLSLPNTIYHSTSCGELASQYDLTALPDPLPEPKYSVRRRLLPTRGISTNETANAESNVADFFLVALNSVEGKRLLVDCLINNSAASYIPLMEHFVNQDDPAYCGVTTLLVVLNAFQVDPKVIRWKGGWRYFANENILLELHPCLQRERIERVGITMEQFQRMASCQGLVSVMKRPKLEPTTNSTCLESTSKKQIDSKNNENNQQNKECHEYSLEEFRADIREALTDKVGENSDKIIVVSFSRQALHQTGDGHYSPVAAYHAATDSILVLDVARFKYQPYWVSITAMYEAFMPLDSCTNLPRGWYVLSTKSSNKEQSRKETDQELNHSTKWKEQYDAKVDRANVLSTWKSIVTSEDRLPAKNIPLAGQGNPCPIHSIKANYCENNKGERR